MAGAEYHHGRINEIIAGRWAIIPETAQGLANALGTSAALRLDPESQYQFARVKKTIRKLAEEHFYTSRIHPNPWWWLHVDEIARHVADR